ncbi:MAG: hypothetical protein CVU89_03010 [Firmicutes bacterium HGW-Firmicutes-14]|nr:MAG: hypothetical protein CVU89_03010 [Firmicutes bacterium HGW-Firmicutes-14]
MKLRTTSLILALVLVLVLSSVFTGCGNASLSGKKQPDATIQKQVINTYLEGLRDLDYDKLKGTVTYSVYSTWPEDREKFKEMLSEQQKPVGAIKTWKFAPDPYVDEVNNQSIIITTVTTEKYQVTLTFDLRKKGDRWRVYGIETGKKVSLDKNSVPSNHP